MEKKATSGIMLTMLLISMLTVLIFFATLMIASNVFVAPATAHTLLQTTEYQVTFSLTYEINPRLGNDGISDIVVYTNYSVIQGVQYPSDIWYRRLYSEGQPYGPEIQVTNTPNDNEFLNDISGDYIVFTAVEGSGTAGKILLYQISSGELSTIGSYPHSKWPRIHGNLVTWIQYAPDFSQIMLYNMTSQNTISLAEGWFSELEIGDRFVVWSNMSGGQFDIFAYNLETEALVPVSSDPTFHEINPSTSGPWIVFQVIPIEGTFSHIYAYNMDTSEWRLIVANGAWNLRPIIDGDLISYESDVFGNKDIFVHKLSTGETFQVTANPAHQFLNDVFDNLVAYVDNRNGNYDIYVSKLTFLWIDDTPPLTTISLSGTLGSDDWYTSDVTVTLTATDDLSGVANTYYSLDGGATWLTYTSTFIITTEGTTTIQYYSVDNWGNTETTKTKTIKIGEDWPMFHHDLSHTGYSTSTAPNTNNTIWSYTTGSLVHSSPAVADGKVYLGSYDNRVYCLNASTGAQIWNYTTGGWVFSSPAVADDKVYIGSWDNKTYCLDASTGAFIWSYTTGAPVLSSPAVAYGKVYVGSNDHKVYCLDALTGAHVWNYTTGYWVSSSPAVADGRVYVGSYDWKVYCLNASTGAHIWSYTTGRWILSSPTVANGRVYVGSLDNKTYCLNASTGAFIWNYTTGSYVDSSPAVADDKVYVGSWDNKVYCLNALNGAHIWDSTIGPIHESSPAVAAGRVYVGSEDYKVYCLNASTGAQIWNYTTDGPVYSSPAIANGTLFIGSSDHKLYAFRSFHDVAVTNITPSKTIVGQGYSMSINVTVENQGSYRETNINVTAYANDTPIQTLIIPSLAPSEQTTITFTWNNAGFAKGNYTISAYAWPVPGETDTADNTYTDGNIIIAMIGDISGPTLGVPDGKVDIRDIALVAKYFGQTVPPAPANCDITGPIIGVPDGKIDIRDIATVAKRFGQKDP